MTTTLPPHGTYKRANGGYGANKGCTCELCAPVARAQRKLNRYRQATGKSFRVPAREAREHLLALRRDMTWDAIAKATGCNPSTLMRIATGEHTQVRRLSHTKIMAVKATPSPEQGRYLDATGTMRRIRALRVMGYSYRAIADAIGTDAMQAYHLAEGHRPQVRLKTAQTVTRVYRQLTRRTIPDSRATSRARNAAIAKGWHGPLAWDDIDNPDAEPELPTAAATPGPRDLAPCGTPAAYRRHVRRDEPIDEACREANRLEWHAKEAQRKANTRKEVAA